MGTWCPQEISSTRTPKTAAMLLRSAGLGVQRPSAIAVARASSKPVRWLSSAIVICDSRQRSATVFIITCSRDGPSKRRKKRIDPRSPATTVELARGFRIV